MNIKVIKQAKDISRVIINEPKTYNSLSTKNLNDLIKVFKKLDNDKKVKVIIIEGTGKGFSAGHNLKEVRNLKKIDKGQHILVYGDAPNKIERAVGVLREFGYRNIYFSL